MTSPVTPDDLRVRAKKIFDRDARAWAAERRRDVVLVVPLNPPTEREALSDLDQVRRWVGSWREAYDATEVELVWAVRNWSRIGSQEIPVRATLRGPEAIARVAGEAAAWGVLVKRLDVLRALAGAEGDGVLRSHARAIADLDDADFDRLVDVTFWLRENPTSGRLIRELPIRGIHTKWIESRRGLVESLHRAGTGASGLGLHEPSPLVRMRVLDPSFALHGLVDVSAPVDDLAAISIRPDRVFVFENLATVLAMPQMAGAVAIHGGGHRVDLIARLPWAHQVTYWGDLDSHGFAILHRLRASGVVATSVLMDTQTVLDHRDLWGHDPNPNTSVLPLLTIHESTTLRLLSAQGNVRLEQERVPWDYALPQLGVE
ncbi:Wadjet anti-phage system protein JetD domain-containing protein [Microbacterium sp. SS28]|uniref:Wadjet anti-phage system protein JetD domain-containing protein n=1 Tax=Microbacterium sp. SS28 TaxID=2919948 RepID=UPI001FAA5445|nr:Wadjet anti-phage system protein JetD domain-containing protein [Microbacterium sp. SS28]